MQLEISGEPYSCYHISFQPSLLGIQCKTTHAQQLVPQNFEGAWANGSLNCSYWRHMVLCCQMNNSNQSKTAGKFNVFAILLGWSPSSRHKANFTQLQKLLHAIIKSYLWNFWSKENCSFLAKKKLFLIFPVERWQRARFVGVAFCQLLALDHQIRHSRMAQLLNETE